MTRSDATVLAALVALLVAQTLALWALLAPIGDIA